MKIKRFSDLNQKNPDQKILAPKKKILGAKSIDNKRLDEDLGKFSNEEKRGSLSRELRKLNDEKRDFGLGLIKKDNSQNKISFTKYKSNNLLHEISELNKEKRNMKLV